MFFNLLFAILFAYLFSPLSALPTSPSSTSTQNSSTVDLSIRDAPEYYLGPDYRLAWHPYSVEGQCFLRSFVGYDNYADFSIFNGNSKQIGFKSGTVGDHFSIGSDHLPWTVEVYFDPDPQIWSEYWFFKYAAWKSKLNPPFVCMIGPDPTRAFITCLAMFPCTFT